MSTAQQAYRQIFTSYPLLPKKDSLACLGVYCLLAAQRDWPETPEEAAKRTQTDPRVLRRYWPHLTAARSASA